MSIRAKILAGCLALTLLTGLLGSYAQWAERDLGALAFRIYDQAFMGVSYLRSAQVNFASLAAASQGDAADAAAIAGVLEDLAVARDRAMSPAGRKAAEGLAGAVSGILKDASASALEAAQSQFERAVETFAGDGFRYRREVGALVDRQMERTSLALALTLMAAVAITVVLGRLIVPPVRKAVQVAQAIAAGQLDNVIPVTGRGETSDLLRALSIMQASIGAALARIHGLMAQQATSHAGELAAQHARMEAALENMNQGLCLFGADGRLAVANRRFSEMFGAPEPGASLETLLRQSGLALLVDSLHGGAVAALSCDLPDGRTIGISQRPVDGGGWVATFEDVSERRAAEERLAHMARHDVLTGLPNRLLLSERLHQLAAPGGASLALFCLGLDRFKAVNETLGHTAGDSLLRGVANRLEALLGDGRFLVRLAGDEFALVQENLNDPLEATALARRMLEALAEPFEIDGQIVVTGASVGIALSNGGAGGADVVDGDALLKCADLAMDRAKADGRGMVRFFAAEMDAAMQTRRALELDLRRALTDKQLELFYQPLVHAGGIAGFEALLRWRHPDRGLISPALFIPLAEETGLIGPIGAWVMQQACQDAAGWAGSLKVAVNLSPVQFRDRDLVADSKAALAASGLAPQRLELEITESVLLQDDESVFATLHALRAQGIRIAMDDFGTGYSSLSYLRRFPFDKIKIDQSFVRGMTEQEDCRAIVRAVIGLGQSLGMAVNAEGVETDAQRDGLRAAGCGELQGFLFSRPQPLSEVPAMLAAHGNATLPPQTRGPSPRAKVAALMQGQHVRGVAHMRRSQASAVGDMDRMELAIEFAGPEIKETA